MMMTLSQLTEFFGWASVLSIALLIVTTAALSVARKFVVSIHSRVFNLPEERLVVLYFQYLANYKLLTLIFIVLPYLSLKIIAS